MSMCRVVSWITGKGCLLWPACSLDKTLLVLPCFIWHSTAKFAYYSRYLLMSYFCFHSCGENVIFVCVCVCVCVCISSRRCYRSSLTWSTSASLASVFGAWTWITMMLNGLLWKQTEITLSFLRLHWSTAFQIFCCCCWLWELLHVFKGFWLTVVIAVVIWIKFPHSHPGFPGGTSGKEPTCQCRRHKRCGVGNIP